MARGALGLAERCPACGVPFEPEEGDFIGAMLVTYSVTAVLVVAGIYFTAALTDLGPREQLLIWCGFGAAFIVGTYRNMKGAWVGILYAMTGLRRDGR